MKLLLVLSLIFVSGNAESFQNVAIDLKVPVDEKSISPRIVNGQQASPNQFPHQALLYINTPQGTYQCGGSLISSVWILSAAHCIIGATTAVARFGSIDRYSMPVVRSAVQISRLATFNPATLKDDISLIKLNATVPTSLNVKPIQLPPASTASVSYLGTVLVVSGFGLTTQNTVSTNLQFTKVVGISLGECRTIYGPIISKNVLCTRGYPNRNQGSCSGDSGGGLVTQNISTIIGIVSFGAAESCTAGHPQGFTKVAPYLSWINAVTAQ